MKVRAVMTRSVKSVAPEAKLTDVAHRMEDGECGSIPVVNEFGQVVGMVTDRDVCLALAKKNLPASEVAVKDVMQPKVYSCGPEDDIQKALRTMQRRKVRRLPVISDDGKLKGIVSIDDIVLYAEESRGRSIPELSYGEAVNTLRAINQKTLERRHIVQP
jgi:CBS domain-containing protein